MKKRIWLLLGMVLVLFSVGAFFVLEKITQLPPVTEKTSLRFVWWGTAKRSDSYIKAINRFEEKYPQYQVAYEYYSWDDYWQKLSIMLVGGSSPDVIQMDYMYLAQLAMDGYLAPLDDQIKSQAIDTTELDPEILATGHIDQVSYGIPATINAVATIGNAGLTAGLAEPFPDYEAWLQAIKEIHQTTGAYGYMDNDDVYVPFQYYLRTKGGELVDFVEGRPRLAFSEEQFSAFFTGMVELARQQSAVPQDYLQALRSMDENPLAVGKAAYHQNWAQMYDWDQSAAERNGQQLVLQIPYGGETTKALAYHPAIMYSIAAKSPEKAGAAKLIDFLTNDPDIMEDLGIERGLPANQALRGQLEARSSGNEQAIITYMNRIEPYLGTISPAPPKGFLQVNEDLNQYYHQALKGAISVADFYQLIVKSFNDNVLINYP